MANKLSLHSPNLQARRASYPDDGLYNEIQAILRSIRQAFQRHADAVNSIYDGPTLPSYTVGTLPSASGWARRMVYVSDEAGGAVPAFSDGTNWRRVTDRAVVS